MTYVHPNIHQTYDSAHPLLRNRGPTEGRNREALATQGQNNSILEPVGLPPGSSGLVNIGGNSCYMNAAVQVISHTYFLRQYLLDNEEKIIQTLLVNAKKNFSSEGIHYDQAIISEIKRKLDLEDFGPDMLNTDERTIVLNSTMTYQTLRLIKGLWKINCNVAPTSFRRIFTGARDKFFFGNDQHDSEEAYSCVIQKIHEELAVVANVKLRARDIVIHHPDPEEKKLLIASFDEIESYYSKSYSKVLDIFSGFFHSSIKCPDETCGYSRDTFEAYFHLSLAIPPGKYTVSLTDCMEMYSTEEILDSNNLWRCDKCKELVPARKQQLLWTSPVVLAIQLKRFGADRVRKDKRFVKYPMVDLDISPIISPVNRAFQQKCYTYKLFSVINHDDSEIGSVNFGHYTAYCLDEDTDQWQIFNDAAPVKKINSSYIVTPEAYMLFYMRCDRLTK